MNGVRQPRGVQDSKQRVLKGENSRKMGSNDSESRATWKQIRGAFWQGIGTGILMAVAFVAGFLYRQYVFAPPTSHTSFRLLSEINALLEQYYLYELPDETTRVHGAASGLVASLNDPYTFFVEPQTAAVDSTNLAGRFGGIGVEVTRDEEGRFVIATVYPDNPAAEAGLMAGDIIVAVDGVEMDTSAADMNQLLSAVRGEIGTPVTLTIQRGAQTFDVRLIRAEVLVPSTFWRVVEQDPRVGYIQVTRFTERAPEEVRQAIAELRDQGVSAYVLDLRNNGGGLVDAAIRITGEFLDGGVVLYEQRSDGEQVYNAPRGGTALDVPLAVLINDGTASAAEIVAGALQDRGRAVLVGQRSFGKGTVQTILSLSDGSSVHITTAQWFTPDHHPIAAQGLTPDVPVEPAQGEDAALLAALDVLAEQLDQARSGIYQMGKVSSVMSFN